MAGRQIKTPGVTETTQQPDDQTQTENKTTETSADTQPVQQSNQSTNETSLPTNEELMAEIEKLKNQLANQSQPSQNPTIQSATTASTGTRIAKLTDKGWTTVEG